MGEEAEVAVSYDGEDSENGGGDDDKAEKITEAEDQNKSRSNTNEKVDVIIHQVGESEKILSKR